MGDARGESSAPKVHERHPSWPDPAAESRPMASPAQRVPLLGGSCRTKKYRRCDVSHSQGCDPGPMLSRRSTSGEYPLAWRF
jgi:hypothetical protein